MTQATYSAVPAAGALWVDNSQSPPALVVTNVGGSGSVPTGSAGSPNAAVVTVQGIAGGTAQPVTLPANQSVNVTQVGGSALALSQHTSAASLPVVIASDQSSVSVTPINVGAAAPSTASVYADLSAGVYNTTMPALATGQQGADQVDSVGRKITAARADAGAVTQVAASGSAGTILAANAARAGATFSNTDTGNLFLYLSAIGTVTTSKYTVKLVPGAYYELPNGYRGIVTGIWDTAGSGSCNVTELS